MAPKLNTNLIYLSPKIIENGKSIIRHELANLAFFSGGHLLLRNLQPNTNHSETDNQAKKTTAKANKNNSHDRKTFTLVRLERVTVQILIPLKRRCIEPREVTTAIPNRRGDQAGELIIRDIERVETNEEAELLGDGTGEVVVVEVDDVEVGAEVERDGDLAGEAVAGEIEDGEVGEFFEVGGDLAGE